MSGKENGYAREMKSRYGNLPQIHFAGLQPREKVFDYYARASALLFPSLLETWGLPISEFKQTGKAMLLADLPYAHETLGTYEKALFFNPTAAHDLAEKMESIISGSLRSFHPVVAEAIHAPLTENWDQLFKMLLKYPVNPQ